MPDSPTAEELEELQRENEALREELADAGSSQAEAEAQATRNIDFQKALAERERLMAEKAIKEHQADPSTVEAGATNVLDAAKSQLAAALAQGEATVGVVDTNADLPPEVEQPPTEEPPVEKPVATTPPVSAPSSPAPISPPPLPASDAGTTPSGE